jgi:hypothetical protein
LGWISLYNFRGLLWFDVFIPKSDIELRTAALAGLTLKLVE